MAKINISDLNPAGADLFLDSESYLNDLTEGEMANTLGGGSCCWYPGKILGQILDCLCPC
ncbi:MULTISPECIES: hypothetical protein [unclassified Okeania]|uniref:hypothetical protein n=1 Tax=unclassified Okeania TaxID=2634635 RepID=UPI0013BA9E94|nr:MULTISPECIES: hypothetical protein [unclassified Okeania]NES78077.1 hypothetical protein [Okeania sp. SIO1H4]NET12679.1 hypothetical protein [Okeania sp. SIO1H6]NET22561.1 hypothetical protein [Okeania sp. SIO1H5]NET95698.1 hypothetical protein [Okeania sp. SIO1H2]